MTESSTPAASDEATSAERSAETSAARRSAAPSDPPPFSVPITVRGYEIDTQGHLNQSVYLQYAEHARWSLFQTAGIGQRQLISEGVGPVVLETTIRYLSELYAGDETEMTCRLHWGTGRTFRIEQTLTRADGTVAAQVTAIGGMIDLTARRLISDPRGFLRKLATQPDLLDR